MVTLPDVTSQATININTSAEDVVTMSLGTNYSSLLLWSPEWCTVVVTLPYLTLPYVTSQTNTNINRSAEVVSSILDKVRSFILTSVLYSGKRENATR